MCPERTDQCPDIAYLIQKHHCASIVNDVKLQLQAVPEVLVLSMQLLLTLRRQNATLVPARQLLAKETPTRAWGSREFAERPEVFIMNELTIKVLEAPGVKRPATSEDFPGCVLCKKPVELGSQICPGCMSEVCEAEELCDV